LQFRASGLDLASRIGQFRTQAIALGPRIRRFSFQAGQIVAPGLEPFHELAQTAEVGLRLGEFSGQFLRS
jgi:hypothetical protein